LTWRHVALPAGQIQEHKQDNHLQALSVSD
jgi:hypothetical protein